MKDFLLQFFTWWNGQTLGTRFNGFYPDTFVEVETPFEDEEGAKAYAAIETMAD